MMDTLKSWTPEQQREQCWQDFEDIHDLDTVRLAQISAFAHTMTPDLLYCLRENFVPQSPWYSVGDILLSGLFMRGSRNLYAMDMPLRELLLKRYIEAEGDEIFPRIGQFMVDYIQHRISQDKNERARVLESKFHWLPLACCNPGTAYEAIRAELLDLAQADLEQGKNPRDRYRLASLVESFASLPSMQPYQSILLEWSKLTRQGESIQQSEQDQNLEGFPLQALSFDETKLVKAGQKTKPPHGLQQFKFKTVRVDANGEIVDRPNCEAFYFEEYFGDDISPLKMIAIRSGRFLMGSPETEAERSDSESPQHWVTVPPFFISQTQITQEQWRFIAQQPKIEIELETNPKFKGDRLPIERVSWFEAVEFCQRLSTYTRRDEYRLPSEAEWEYACRAGSTTPFAFGETISSELANYDARGTYGAGTKGKYQRRTTKVGSFFPNAFGLFDMHGNIWEWCQDHWHGTYQGAPDDGSAWITGGNSDRRILRGGSWINLPASCRSARRLNYDPRIRDLNNGFRVVCAVPRSS